LDSKHLKKTPSLLGGGMIIAGTIIGGGMLALPIATAGIGYYHSILLLFFSWFCMSYSGLMLLEANLHYPEGASFDTLVKDLLGKKWNILTGLSIAFVLYTLTYAYITVGGSITHTLLGDTIGLESSTSSILFCLFLATFVWFSTQTVDRVSTLLITAMVISFFAMTTGLLGEINLNLLFETNTPTFSQSNLIYFFIALPVCVTSFGFHGNVPSLVSYYNRDGKKIEKSILLGSAIALLIYALWQTSIYGNLPSSELLNIQNAEDDIGLMIEKLSSHVQVDLLSHTIGFFTYAAIISSFLGVALGLFDYIADLFSIKDTKAGRFKTALLTFVPPLLASLFFPYGFTIAISYVGFGASIWAIIVPALLVVKSRKKFPQGAYKVFGGYTLVYLILLFGGLTITSIFISLLVA